MRYLALATDYDGTLAHDGQVDADTLAALHLLRSSGRRLIMVTGRELPELKEVFPHLDIFERVVAENGALLYNPATKEERVLGEPPPPQFIEDLKRRGVTPLSVGRSIVATLESQETMVLESIRDLGIERQVIFNKGSVMVLPSGVNKATGLKVALDELKLSPRNTVGVGDAENDHAFLAFCECSAAVGNALPMLKERADIVLARPRGSGVSELIEHLVNDDLKSFAAKLTRHDIVIGNKEDGSPAVISPYCQGLLLAGSSGAGKSTLSTAFIERLSECGYQFCVIDPEGDYGQLSGAVSLGDGKRPPSVEEVLQVLESPAQNLVVNLLGVALDKRPEFFDALLPRLLELRSRTGRPHWLIIDEAHHLLPSSWDTAKISIPQSLTGTMFITLHPEHMSRAALALVETVLLVGTEPARRLRGFAEMLGIRPPAVDAADLDRGQVMAWTRTSDAPPFSFDVIPPKGVRMRHVRKYVEGELPPERSFYFRGREGKLKLRAQNLVMFLQLAEGVDDDTWRFHLEQGDYSKWFEERIKDSELCAVARAIEREMAGAPAEESRARIREEIEKRYTQAA